MQIEELTAGIDSVKTEVANFDKISAGLDALEKAHPKDIACEVTTPAGMKMAIAGRAAWREPRIAVEKARKAAKDPVLKLGKAIDSFAADLETKLRAGEDHYDEQIKAEEQRKDDIRKAQLAAEAKRQAGHETAIARIRGAVTAATGEDSETIAGMIKTLTEMPTGADVFEEFHTAAETAKVESIESLRIMLAKVEAQEQEAVRIAAERAELVKLREEQSAREAEDRARAEKERAEEARRIQAERDKLLIEQAAARKEQKRLDDIAAEERRAADAAAKSERDEADRIARESRAAEQAKADEEMALLRKQQVEAKEKADAELAERRHLQDEADAKAEAARVERARAEREAADKAARAVQRLQGAAQQMLDALVVCVPVLATCDYQAELAQANEAIAAATGEA